MLDAKLIRTEPEKIKQSLINRNMSTKLLDDFLELDAKRRSILAESESLKARKNAVSGEIAKMKKAKEDASAEIAEMRDVSAKIKDLDTELASVEESLSAVMYSMPNIPAASTPIGKDETENQVLRYWGDKREFDFEPAYHWDIASKLDIIDFERGSKISGSGFILYKGLGARLERSLFNWMLDLHTQKQGYKEIFPPFLINRKAMTGTGQLPKFEEDMYHADKDDDLFLDPTAEVPVTNIHMDEILDAAQLPIYYTAYSACFRREAGSAGKDTRGLLRVHQFNKVEMVKFVKPETSYDEHEKLLADAEEVLRLLNIPYRILALCTGDVSFSAAKCYDIEIWAPAVGKWLEVSSCSNFEDFQARRANIRYRPQPGAKPEFVHTLNGSGVALPRLVVSLIENYQQADGSVVVPEVLRPYMGVDVIK